uniref:Nudix hydrolase domain-containing protein n=1 Tax=viral metagenome TaxID=1070528 RepID=A0A6C0C901_9ZZZZ
MEYETKYNKKKICINCGKHDHEFKLCRDPITSFGIVNVKILDCYDDKNNLFKSNFSTKKNVKYILTSRKYSYVKCNITDCIRVNEGTNNYKLDNESIKYNVESQIQKFCYYKNKVLFLMVSRRFSIGFIEFVRGKYQVTDSNTIIKLFEQMSANEISMIQNNSYDDLLFFFLNKNNETKENLLHNTYNGKYSLEYLEAKNKFDMLSDPENEKNGTIPWGLNFYIKNIKPKWKTVEWGFPKGRRGKRTEENLSCACREFEEETGYHSSDYHILNRIEPIEEYLVGTNNVNYKHIYYLAIDMFDPNQSKLSNFDEYEIGDVKWFTFDDAIKNIRPYHVGKKCILTKIYMFIINYLVWHDEYLL